MLSLQLFQPQAQKIYSSYCLLNISFKDSSELFCFILILMCCVGTKCRRLVKLVGIVKCVCENMC